MRKRLARRTGPSSVIGNRSEESFIDPFVEGTHSERFFVATLLRMTTLGGSLREVRPPRRIEASENAQIPCFTVLVIRREAVKSRFWGTRVPLPRVVIVGGGFGGLFATRELARAPVSVTLIDKRNYHLFRPMLYQVATGLLSADEIAGPLRSILSRQQNVEVLLDEVSGIDTEKRLVHLKQHMVPYDFLVLATGIQYNYFGHEDWRARRRASNRWTTPT